MKEKRGLVITYKDWVIKADTRKRYSHLFDLYVMSPVEKTKEDVNGNRIKTGEVVMEEELVGYGMTLSAVIGRIIRQAVANENERLTLKGYREKIDEEFAHLKTLLNDNY